MSNFIMVIGLPASGKSTITKALAEKYKAIIHSSDAIRYELFGSEDVQDKNNLVFRTLHNRVKQDLINNKNVIYDATNISYKKRKSFLTHLNQVDNINCQKICYLIATPYEKCLEQNRQRDRVVPEHVIRKMYKSIYIPQFYEGWDNIEIFWNTEGYYLDTNELFNGENGLNKIEQDNPHHTLTIGKHCLKCFQLCEQKLDELGLEDFELNMASLYHDIGKRFTKSFRNSKREFTEIAHYYNHEFVSAYDSLFIFYQQGFENKEILKIANYIQWHMQPFFIKSESAKNRFVNLVGQEFYDRLLILHEADENAK